MPKKDEEFPGSAFPDWVIRSLPKKKRFGSIQFTPRPICKIIEEKNNENTQNFF